MFFLSARGKSLVSNTLFFAGRIASTTIQPLTNMLGLGLAASSVAEHFAQNNLLKSASGLISSLAFFALLVENNYNYADSAMLLSSMLGSLELCTRERENYPLTKLFAKYVSLSADMATAYTFILNAATQDKLLEKTDPGFLIAVNLIGALVAEFLEIMPQEETLALRR